MREDKRDGTRRNNSLDWIVDSLVECLVGARVEVNGTDSHFSMDFISVFFVKSGKGVEEWLIVVDSRFPSHLNVRDWPVDVNIRS
jgi:hypothetical protein